MSEGTDDTTQATDAALDRLYATRPEDFVQARKELAAELKASGDTALAKRVLQIKKPSRATWALNQFARKEPELLGILVKERERAARAQTSGVSLRDALESYRNRLAEAVHAAVLVAEQTWSSLGAAERRRIGQSLEAAVADEQARTELARGRLAESTGAADPFAALAPSGGPPDAVELAREEATRARELERAEQRKQSERERQLQKAKLELASAEKALEKASEAADRARARLQRAKSEVEQALAECTELDARREKAAAAVRALEAEN